jgi:radical SAM/Cys-rich protein
MNRPLPILSLSAEPSFDDHLLSAGLEPLRSHAVTTLQVNLGRRCNQACHHCHVDAGPMRTEEMSTDTANEVMDVLRRCSFDTLDITGGAPEINGVFRPLVEVGVAECERVIDRSNLTIFFEPGHHDLPEFLASHGVEVVASLPCYEAANVDQQRGSGVFDLSIRALQRLNALGYGRESNLVLNLVFNPLGPALPPSQADLESQYKEQLRARYGIVFNQLYTITNMPINRFRHELEREGQLAEYMRRLTQAFNRDAVPAVMCRDLVSVGWDGRLYDCDFNQMLELPVAPSKPQHIRDFDTQQLASRAVQTAAHCFACTAGQGSSCQGVVA